MDFAVPRALVPYVAATVPYDLDMGGPGVHRGVPSTAPTFVLPLDDPLDIAWADDPGSRRPRAWSVVSGLHTKPVHIRHDGHQRGVQLALTPAGTRALFGVPASELAGELVALDELAPGLEDLPERVAAAADAAADPGDGARRAAAVVHRALTDALGRRHEPVARAEVGRALAQLTRGVPASVVAREVGYSRRRLHTLVREETGLSPTGYRRVARFARVRRMVSWAARARPGTWTLADVAAAAGYADQAHLTREFVELAGCTPTTWLREEFPFVQDVGAEPAAG